MNEHHLLHFTLEEGMETHSSILAWRIPWTEEPGWLQSMGLLRVGHLLSDFILSSGTPEPAQNREAGLLTSDPSRGSRLGLGVTIFQLEREIP